MFHHAWGQLHGCILLKCETTQIKATQRLSPRDALRKKKKNLIPSQKREIFHYIICSVHRHPNKQTGMLKSTAPHFAISHVLKSNQTVRLQLQYALKWFLSQVFFPEGEEMEL